MYLLFDVGGTKMRMTLWQRGRKIKIEKMVATPPTFKEGLIILKEFSRHRPGKDKIKAVAGGIAGSFDRTKSQIIDGGENIQGWVGPLLKKELERAFGVPVYLENDAALAGLAEALKGAGRGKEIVVYYTVSTGFGGARIVNGKIDSNARGFEPTNQIVDIAQLRRNYRGGRIGHYLSGRGIEASFHTKAENITNPKIRDELAFLLAVALNNGILHWSPDIIVVGGSVMNIISLSRAIFYLKKAPPPVVKSQWGELAVLYGAVEYLREKGIA